LLTRRDTTLHVVVHSEDALERGSLYLPLPVPQPLRSIVCSANVPIVIVSRVRRAQQIMAADVHAPLAAEPHPGASAQAYEPAAANVPEDMGTVPPAPIVAAPAAEDVPIDGLGQLTVTDALSYLDAVKVQFADQPDVYERFLAVMKDFRNQLYVESSLLRGGYAYELVG
jgi:hypothetical protein